MESRLLPVATSVGVLEEGVALMHGIEAGAGVVLPTAGTSGDVFAGVSQSKPVGGLTGTVVEEKKVPDSGAYKVVLDRTPSGAAADRGVFNAAGTALTSAATVDAATKYNLTGKEVTVDSTLAGQTIRIQYQYALTAAEALLQHGGGLSMLDLSGAKNITVITAGIVFTTMYDPGTNWSDPALVIHVGANGKFTGSGSGAIVNAVVNQVPGVGDPMLGLYIIGAGK